MAAIISREAFRETQRSSDPDSFEQSAVRKMPATASESTIVVDGDGPAEVRVQSFLDCVETRRQRSNRAGWMVLGVGAVVASVAYLTSIGVVGPDARAAAASAGTLVVGYIVGNR